ncbi:MULTISPECIES: Smr/MutS family protein [unclassified Acidisoma]|uniref:Smr/MutS family protein n=1 Tax=unclassified Acidisoma TaxID=2634065 RepID=UPI0020B15D02|nr:MULTISPECIES: Smr/MutS family protein [unclassified Acidisoma]
MRHRPLSEHEREEWATFTRSIGTRPLRGRSPAASLPKAAPAQAAPSQPPPVARAAEAVARPPAAARKPAVKAITVGGAAAGLDSSSWEKLRAGRMRPQRTLDLHGRTAQSAFLAFSVFIQNARHDRLRCVEIVTGRGSGEGGVLRRELPHWINLPHLRALILAATHPSQTNTGSVRLLLRRVR